VHASDQVHVKDHHKKDRQPADAVERRNVRTDADAIAHRKRNAAGRTIVYVIARSGTGVRLDHRSREYRRGRAWLANVAA
jgi:hypothetical protein